MTEIISIYPPSWDSADSYGRIVCELAARLEARGHHVNRWGVENARIVPTFGGVLAGYPVDHGEWGPLANGGPRLALTFWESDALPPGWVEVLNACAAVTTGAHFVRDLFVQSGVTVPVHVHPLGISDAFQYRQRPARDGLRVIVIGDRGDRKNADAAIQGFVNAFGLDMRYRLTLKRRARKDGEYRMTLIGHPNITVIDADMSEAELAALYAEHDVMLFPARGEGFGFPPREFARTGGIALATDWSGTRDDIGEWGIPIPPGELIPAWTNEPRGSEWMHGLGRWANPDPNAIAALLRWIAGWTPKQRTAWGEQVADNTARLYSWERYADGVLAAWRAIVTPEAAKPIWSEPDGNRITA